jgi:molecular chaperone Hsp33
VGDACVKAGIRSAGLEVAVATTTDLTRDAQKAHKLAPTSIIALGRLLSAATLIAQTSKRRGSTSLQILSRARLGQVFADVTHDGNARGMVKNPTLSFPFAPEEKDARRPISAALLPGKLFVVRSTASGQYTQSTTDLVSGEVDLDVEYFLEQSDQIPTALAADVLIAEDSTIALAGGVLAQALPGADLGRLEAIRARVRGHGFGKLLRDHGSDPVAMLKAIAPDAMILEAPAPLAWRCRCSYARVLDALKMLGPQDLAEMVDKKDDVEVGCDLCGAQYVIPRADVEQVFFSTIKAQS